MSICIRNLLKKTFYYNQRRSYSELFSHRSIDAHSSISRNDGMGSNLGRSLENILGSFLARRSGQGFIHEAQLALRTGRYSIHPYKTNIQKLWERLNKINGFIYRKRVWQSLYMKNMFYKPVLPPFGLVVRAVSLAFSRSHLTLGLVALAIGSMNGFMAEAQPSLGNGSSYRSEISPAFFSAVICSIADFLTILLRAVYLLYLFTPVVLASIFADSFGDSFRKAWLQLVCHTLELAGAAFIKWGQWAATRPDLFPRDLCIELSKLHMKAPTHNYSYTAQTVEKAFGRKLQDIFEEFEEDPVASGSIAQVHRATLRFHRPGGKSNPVLVAVKVRHPGVVNVIRQDFVIINWIARLCTFAPGLKWLRLDESVQQFAVFMQTQVDLSWEAAHLSRFLYNFRQSKDVSFPKPLYPLVHPAVLVETYEKGESVSRFVELPEKSRINSALARIGTHTLLKMLLVDNFIHADMHPGNILVRVDGKKGHSSKSFFPSRPHVVFLDVGMTAELSGNDRTNLLDFFRAVAKRDGRRAAEYALKFSNDQSCPNPKAFIEGVESSFKLWNSEEGNGMRPGECFQDLLEQIRKHRVNIDGEVCAVMVTTMVLEGWQRKLDPEYSLMKTLQTILFKVEMAESLSYTIHAIMAP